MVVSKMSSMKLPPFVPRFLPDPVIRSGLDDFHLLAHVNPPSILSLFLQLSLPSPEKAGQSVILQLSDQFVFSGTSICHAL